MKKLNKYFLCIDDKPIEVPKEYIESFEESERNRIIEIIDKEIDYLERYLIKIVKGNKVKEVNNYIDEAKKIKKLIKK